MSEQQKQFVVTENTVFIDDLEYKNIQYGILVRSNMAALEKLLHPLNLNGYYLSVTDCNIVFCVVCIPFLISSPAGDVIEYSR